MTLTSIHERQHWKCPNKNVPRHNSVDEEDYLQFTRPALWRLRKYRKLSWLKYAAAKDIKRKRRKGLM